VLVHECGHIAVAAKYGSSPSHILLWPLGGMAVTAMCGQTHRQQAEIAAAGPATHVPMALVWLALLATTGNVSLSTAVSSRMMPVAEFFSLLFRLELINNLLLFAFNLFVPCFPLDCSQIIVSVLAMRGWSRLRIVHFILASSAVAIVVIASITIYFMSTGDSPVAAMGGLFVAFWLGVMSLSLYKLYKIADSGQPEVVDAHPLFAGACYSSSAGGNGIGFGVTVPDGVQSGDTMAVDNGGHDEALPATRICAGGLLMVALALWWPTWYGLAP
jgi:Zn-dependent protease